MTDRAARVVLDRLRAVEWAGEWDFAFGHVKSRRVLFREYLRRAAVWSRAHGGRGSWLLSDVTPYVDPDFRLSPAVAEALAELLRRPSDGEVRSTCSGAVRLAELRGRKPEAFAGLPDLYEPLLLFWERGGEFARDDAGFIDLTGVLIRPGPLEACAGNPPVTDLSDIVLDALDVDGRVTYYTSADGRRPLLRRCVRRDGPTDQSLGRALRWEPTDLIPASDEAVRGAGLVTVDELEAARLIGQEHAAAQPMP
ncbi:hypothetical protein [Streptomyces sp. NPDC001568]|uniref:hypothetical protein n=1 Tax=Streptomyces sp. NPDC001568 TaxID=3364588 RepID=UPI0036CDCA81